jgi:hypothetical protein
LLICHRHRLPTAGDFSFEWHHARAAVRLYDAAFCDRVRARVEHCADALPLSSPIAAALSRFVDWLAVSAPADEDGRPSADAMEATGGSAGSASLESNGIVVSSSSTSSSSSSSSSLTFSSSGGDGGSALFLRVPSPFVGALLEAALRREHMTKTTLGGLVGVGSGA